MKGAAKPLSFFLKGMYSIREIQEGFESYIQNLDYSHEPDNLYSPVRYVLAAGGKRLRPTLLISAFNMFADDVQRVWPVAAGMEIFHNFTLLHDDLMDNADMRRNRPTVHKKWNANTAILSGDVMLVLAYRFLANADLDKLKPVLDVANQTFMEIMDGQQYDMDFESRNDVTESEYLEMIRLKTSVLLAACLKMGALLGGASDHDSQLLYGFGEKIGLAFQLQDDYLDVYGDPKTFGKKIGGDILCNKKTYLYINACRLANESQSAELAEWALYDGDNPESKICAVRNIYDQTGVPEMSERLIDRLFNEGMAMLDQVSLPEERKSILREYAYSLLGRKN